MECKGRFAPSPSGRMHLGNVYAALMSWLSVKRKGGKWLLRIEDLDPQRSRLEYAKWIEDDLHWLGLDWDEGGLDGIGPNGPYLQSQRSDLYNETLRKLSCRGLTYPCRCTRADNLSANAPHQSDGRVIYSGRCRPSAAPPFPQVDDDAGAAIRIFAPDETIEFHDIFQGPQRFNLARDCGDFILRRKDGVAAYQLAVVVDDALMGVTEVVRGEDLLLSAAQQIYLFRELGYNPPDYGHIPLLKNASGQRLSKRDASQSMEELRRIHTPASLLGLLAHQAGLRPTSDPVSPEVLL